ncbi:MAG: transcriptional regulator NrdR [Miltoncostaeaceae bacterium]
MSCGRAFRQPIPRTPRRWRKTVICPFCDHAEHRVVESRVADTKDAIRRRRECSSCGRRFTSYERVEETPLLVIKESGEQRACHKRAVPTGLLEVAVRDIEGELRNRLRHEVRSSIIGDLALRRLKEIDAVAYVRFASVYRAFEDVDEFEEELARLELEPPLPRGQGSFDEQMFDTLTTAGAGNGSGAPRGRLRALRGGRDTTTTIDSQEAPDGD